MISSACLRLRRSANGDGGSASSDGISSDRWRASSATMIVSRTREPAEAAGVLEGAAHALAGAPVRGHAVDASAEHLDVARRLHEPGDGVHQRGLARAVRADEPDDLAGAHLDATPPTTTKRPPKRTRTSGATSGAAGGSAPSASCFRRRQLRERRVGLAARVGFQSVRRAMNASRTSRRRLSTIEINPPGQ